MPARSIGDVSGKDSGGRALGPGCDALGAKSYPSARITSVSGWTPSCFIASAAGSVCMNS